MSELSAIDTLFKAASNDGSLEDLANAISAGVDINTISPQWKATPLQLAVIYRNFDKVKLLVEKGADLEIVGSMMMEGKTVVPLEYARSHQLFEITSFLEQTFGDKCPPPDASALKVYAENNDLDGMRRELDKGVDINGATGQPERSALYVAIDREAKIETIKFLLDNGANAQEINQFGVRYCKHFSGRKLFNLNLIIILCYYSYHIPNTQFYNFGCRKVYTTVLKSIEEIPAGLLLCWKFSQNLHDRLLVESFWMHS